MAWYESPMLQHWSISLCVCVCNNTHTHTHTHISLNLGRKRECKAWAFTCRKSRCHRSCCISCWCPNLQDLDGQVYACLCVSVLDTVMWVCYKYINNVSVCMYMHEWMGGYVTNVSVCMYMHEWMYKNTCMQMHVCTSMYACSYDKKRENWRMMA